MIDFGIDFLKLVILYIISSTQDIIKGSIVLDCLDESGDVLEQCCVADCPELVILLQTL